MFRERPCLQLHLPWRCPRAWHPGRDPNEPICMTKVPHGASAKKEEIFDTSHGSHGSHITWHITWNLHDTSHIPQKHCRPSDNSSSNTWKCCKSVSFPSFPSICRNLSRCWLLKMKCIVFVLARFGFGVELQTGQSFQLLYQCLLFRNRCGLWCFDQSKDHSLSGIGRHHHAGPCIGKTNCLSGVFVTAMLQDCSEFCCLAFHTQCWIRFVSKSILSTLKRHIRKL